VYEPLEAVAAGAAGVPVVAVVLMDAMMPVEASAKPWVRAIATEIVA
jgi:hypothetical protein